MPMINRWTGIVAVALALVARWPTVALAQSSRGPLVWVTTTDGTEHQGQLVSFTPSRVMLRGPGDETRTVSFSDVRRVEIVDRVGDGTRNGALIGAGVFLVPTIGVLRVHSSGAAVFGAMVLLEGAAFGAAIGTLTDDLHHSRKPLFGGTGRGEDVFVTTAEGVEYRGRLESFTTTSLTLSQASGATPTVAFADIRTVERPDGLANGARTGAVLGTLIFALPGVFALEDRSDSGVGAGVAALLLIGAGAGIGAGVGVLVDWMIPGRERLFSASDTTAPGSLTIEPLVAPRAMGVGVSVRWR